MNFLKKTININFNKNSIKWILLIIVLLFSLFIFMYEDMTNTVDNTLTFLDSVFQGKVLNFYELSVENAQTSYAANYNVLVYVIFSIWFLPFYIVYKIMGLSSSMLSPTALLWGKFFIVIAAISSTYLIYKIITLCNVKKEKANLTTFLFFSSMIVFYVIFMIVQIDIIAIFFMLLGLYGYLKNNKLLFWISFTIATPLKMFAIFLSLPLILLREKNLFKAGITWLSTMSLLILENLIFSGSSVYKYALAAQSTSSINQLLSSRHLHWSPNHYICCTLYCTNRIFIYYERKRK